MKSMLLAFAPFLLSALATAATSRDHSSANLQVVKPEEKKQGPEKKEDEAPASLESLRIKFEIENFNYYDLTKETCPEKIKKKHYRHKRVPEAKADKEEKKVDKTTTEIAESPELPVPSDSPLFPQPGKLPWMKKGEQDTKPPPPPPAAAPTVDVKPAIDEVHANSDHISDQVKKGLGNRDTNDSGLPWMKKNGAASFLQVEAGTKLGACVARQDMGETKSLECTTVMDVLRDTIKETVRGIIRCLYLESLENKVSGPAPAPALPAAPASAFLVVKPAKGSPAPAPAGPTGPPEPKVQIFVTFTPGKKIGDGASTIVEISFLDTTGNSIDDVKAAKPFLVWCMQHGLFDRELGDALEQVTHIAPEVHETKMDTQKIEQWDIKKCEKHLRSIVGEFAHHYTRRQVPMALYNECTNFMTRMSFSHDYVLDPMDTVRCRRSTRKFAQHWNYGKKAEEKDFGEMCHHACEAKYGRRAPTCNVKHGDKLLAQPLL